MSLRREELREAVLGEVVGEDEGGAVKLGPAEGGLGEGRQVISRLCEEVERLPARLIEEWRAEEPELLGMKLTAEMEMAIAFTLCLGSNG